MAGPFQTSGNNAPDLAPINLQGGFTAPAAPADPTTAAIEGVTEAVKTVGALNTNRLKKEAVSGIQQEVKSIRDAIQISKHPNLAQSYFSKEALKDPYIKQVYEQFNAIKNASDQGRMSQEFALERMDAAMSAAINRRPQFADAIRTAANEAAGANISSKLFTQIMATTPQQEAFAALQREAMKVGLPVEQYQRMAQQQFFRTQISDQVEYQKTLGSLTLDDMTQQMGAELTNLTRNLQNGLLERIHQGGVIDVPVTVQQARNDFADLRRKVLGNIPKNVSSSQIAEVTAMIDREETSLIEQIENGTMVKVLQSQGQLFDEVARHSARTNAPTEMQIISIWGNGPAGIEATNMYKKAMNNEGFRQVMFASGEGGSFTVSDAATQVYKAGRIFSGEGEAQTDQERRLAGYLSGVFLQREAGNSGNGDATPPSPQKVLRAVDLVTEMGEEYSTATLADSRVAAGVRNYKEVHPQLINHFNSDLRSLQRAFNELKSQGALTDESVSIRNGLISVGGNTIVSQFGAGNTGTSGSGALTPIQKWLRQANLTLKMGQVYQSNGVFPDTVFRNSNAFLDALKTGGIEEGNVLTGGNEGESVVEFDYDDRGNIIRVER